MTAAAQAVEAPAWLTAFCERTANRL